MIVCDFVVSYLEKRDVFVDLSQNQEKMNTFTAGQQIEFRIGAYDDRERALNIRVLQNAPPISVWVLSMFFYFFFFFWDFVKIGSKWQNQNWVKIQTKLM